MAIPADDRRFGILGAGNMGEAFMRGLIRSGGVAPTRISAADLDLERLSQAAHNLGITPCDDNLRLFRESDILILAVKPQQTTALLGAIAAAPSYAVAQRKTLLSVVAGYPLARMEAILYPPLPPDQQRRLPLLRVMPNTPALIGCGMSAFCGNRWVADADRELAQAILASLGRVLQVAEGELDAVTALSGSGPAYLFFLLEQMIGAGVAAGLSQETARILALQTVKGAAALMEAGGESPEALRRRVTSPGGTTEAALKVLEARGVGPALLEAIAAARRRSAELGAG